MASIKQAWTTLSERQIKDIEKAEELIWNITARERTDFPHEFPEGFTTNYLLEQIAKLLDAAIRLDKAESDAGKTRWKTTRDFITPEEIK